MASRTRHDTWIFLANRHPTQTARVSLDGFGDNPDIVALAADSPTEQMRASDAVRNDNGVVTLPPLAICRLQFDQR